MSVSFGGGGGGGGTTVTVNVVNSGATIFISGQCVCISGQSVNVSGDFVVLGSGSLAALSGLPVAASISFSGVSLASNVSGNVVYLPADNVNNVVAISGSIVKTSGQVAQISGQAVTTSISGNVVNANVTTSVSGQVVYLANDNTNNVVAISGAIVKTSGQVAQVSGQAVSTSVSGNIVQISGQVVSISGQPVSVSVATNISGQVVVPVSGQSFGFIWDYSGLTWTQAATSNSGTNKLLVDAGSISVASNISGQVVQFASGGNTVTIASGAVVQISGQTVVATATANISGQAVFLGSGSTLGLSGLAIVGSVSGNVVSTSVSGNVVAISGSVTTITSVSGNVVSVSGLWTSTTLQSGQYGVSGAAGVLNYMYDYSGLNWAPIPATNSGIRIPRFTNSGDACSTSISGNVVAVSGTVTIAGAVTTSVSGNQVYLGSGFNYVFISGGPAVSVSGNVVSISGTATIAGAVTTNISGNTVLTVPAWYGAVPVSGWYLKVSGPAFSGANTVGNYVFDYSGQQFVAWAATTSGQGIPFVSVASGIAAQVSGASVLTSVSGNVVSTSVSGNVVGISGQVVSVSGTVTVAGAVTTNVSGNTVLNVPAWYGAVAVSGWYLKVSGPAFSGANTVGNYVFDYSGQQFVAWTATTSGQGIPFVSVASGVAAQISGASVLTSVSGNILSVTGGGVSVSGNVVSISGTATIAGAVTTNVSGNTVLNVPSWYGAVAVSGWFLKVSGPAFSGANTVGNYVFDYSGQQFIAWASTTSGQGVPQVSVGSGIAAQVSGASVLTSVSGNVVSTSVSGNVVGISGQFVSISGIYFSTAYESGLGAVSGVMGPAGLMAWDLSGLKWNPLAVDVSGSSKLNVAATVNATANISGQAVFLGSGSTLGISGLFWTGSTMQSGQYGVSGGAGALAYAYDYSGLNWAPIPTSTSGVRIPVVNISGNMVSISGTVTATVSGNTVLPKTPTFIKSNDATRFSVASGGTALTSITCVACTIRNIGNSGDVIFVGSLSSPPYFGTSGQAWPAVSGAGLWLRDGDAVTINTNDTANIKITANLSGTPVSYIAIG